MADTLSALWVGQDVSCRGQADDHTAEHGTLITEMATGGDDGEPAVRSLSLPSPGVALPTNWPQKYTDTFRILQIIPKQKQKWREKKNNDTARLIYINKMLVCSLASSGTTFWCTRFLCIMKTKIRNALELELIIVTRHVSVSKLLCYRLQKHDHVKNTQIGRWRTTQLNEQLQFYCGLAEMFSL